MLNWPRRIAGQEVQYLVISPCTGQHFLPHHISPFLCPSLIDYILLKIAMSGWPTGARDLDSCRVER